VHSELFQTVFSVLLVLRDVVKVVYISDTNVELSLMNNLDFVKNLETNLRIHYRYWLLVSYFTSNKEAYLLKFVQQLTESQAIFAKVIYLSKN